MWTRRAAPYALSLLSLPLVFAAAQEPAASLRGTVTDSIRHGPLVGATVVAMRTSVNGAADSHDYSTTTDPHGKFTITSLPPGRYVLTVEHPWLDSTGLGVPAQTVDLTRRRAAAVSLAVPSGATIRAAFCPGAARDSSMGFVAGYVKDVHSDHPVVGARIVFAWGDFDVDQRSARATPRSHTAAMSTGPDGTFRLCGLPVQLTMLMQAQLGDHEATGAVEVQVPRSGVLVETLRLDANPVAATTVGGDVKREGSERPIAGAHVHLYGAASEVLTAADGSFVLNDVPFGTQSIEVTALGFYPRRYALDVHPDGMGRASIDMAETATVLDSVKILGKGSSPFSPHREFDERSVRGAGQYITAEMIAKANPLQTAELMQQVNGFYVMSDTVYSSRGLTRLEISTPAHPVNRVCQPVLYIDGGLSPRTMNDILPNSIYGIEIYASGSIVPPKYPPANCGAIFIWTK
jgi:hypothetical protein